VMSLNIQARYCTESHALNPSIASIRSTATRGDFGSIGVFVFTMALAAAGNSDNWDLQVVSIGPQSFVRNQVSRLRGRAVEITSAPTPL
jgi:hypothetical protein